MISNICFTLSLVALLMFLDYYFTLKNYRLYKEKVATIIEVEQFELNPEFQSLVYKNQYSHKHFWGVIVLIAFLWAVWMIEKTFELSGGESSWFQFFATAVIAFLLFVLFQHTRNFLNFRAYNKSQTGLEGKLKQSYLYALQTSRGEAVGMMIVFLIHFLLVPSYVAAGFIFGLILMIKQQSVWKKKYLKSQETGVK